MKLQKENRRTVIGIMVLAVLLLGALGIYLFAIRPHSAETLASSKRAAQQADSAVAAAGMNAADRNAIEAIVRAYILEHPEIITEAVAVLQSRDLGKRLASVGTGLTTAFAGDAAGNKNGDVTVVEFTDYNCGYCRSSVADVEKLVATDKNIRLVYREVPLLADTSRDAALWALAAAKQGKHDAFHRAMFSIGAPDEGPIMQAAGMAKLNIPAAIQFTKSAEASEELDANIAMMQKIGFTGTPTFVIGDQILEGAQGYEKLKAAVQAARKSNQ
jgi:protein-disulfide isomerase